MRIVFFGDSITDAGRNRNDIHALSGLGYGFVRAIADRIQGAAPDQYEIINTGIGGNRVVDLYARIKCDLWNLNPDVISILIGVNDVWHEIGEGKNGVELDRFERVYRMIIEDTRKVLPNAKFVLCEPFVLEGKSTCDTEEMPDRFSRFQEVYQYAEVVKKLAEEYHLLFLPLQAKFDEAAAQIGASYYCTDGVHPNVGGASLIAREWVDLFEREIK